MYLVAVNLNAPTETAAVEATPDRPIRIGRKPESLPEEPVDLLQVTWKDRLVSRNHCQGVLEGDQIRLERLPALTGRSTPNALYTSRGVQDRVAVDEPAHLAPNQSVIIGARGTTALFCLENLDDLDAAMESYREEQENEKQDYQSSPISSQSYDEVVQLDEYSLRLQLKLLQKDLPEQVLTGWTDDLELFTRAALFLENALPGQKGAGSKSALSTSHMMI